MLYYKSILTFALVFFILQSNTFAQESSSYSSIIVNELSYNPRTGESFIELLVPDNGEHVGEFVDISGWIIDNYSDNYDDDNAMIRLGPYFSEVKPGTLIVIYDHENPHSAILAQSNFEFLTLRDQILFVPLDSDKLEIISESDFDNGDIVRSSNTDWGNTLNLKSSNNGIFVWSPNGTLLNGIAWMNYNTPYSQLRGVTNLGNGLPLGSFSIFAGTLCPTEMTVQVGSAMVTTPGFPNNAGNSNSVGSNPQPLYFSVDCRTSISTSSSNSSQGEIEFIGGQPPFEVSIYNADGDLHWEEETSGPIVVVDGIAGEEYKVVVADNRGCKERCSYRLPEDIDVLDICKGERVRIGKNIDPDCFKWEPEEGLYFPNSAFPMAGPAKTTTYVLMISDGCGAITSRHEYKVVVQDVEPLEIVSDTDPPIVKDQDIILSTTGNWVSYSWSAPYPTDVPGGQPTFTIIPEQFNNGVQPNPTTIHLHTYNASGCKNETQIEIFSDPCDGQDFDGDGVCDDDDFDPEDPCIPYEQDTDGDGLCDGDDCNKHDPLIGKGLPCNDELDCTINDTYDSNCNCVGEDVSVGQLCDDQNDCTINDKYDGNCICKGIPSLQFEITNISDEPCQNGLVILSTDTEFDHYRWFNSNQVLIAESRSVEISSSGQYFIEVYNSSNCSERKSIFVDDYSANGMEIVSDGNVICGNGDHLQLNIGENYTSTIWQDESGSIVGTENTLSCTTSGTYNVTATTAFGCVVTGEKEIASSMGDFSFEPEYPILCDGGQLELSIIVSNQNSNNLQVRWFDEEEGLSRIVNEVGIYGVTITDENDCTTAHKFEVESEAQVNIEPILLAEGFESIDIEIVSITTLTGSDDSRGRSSDCNFSVSEADVYELRIPSTGETFVINESLLDYEMNSEICESTIGVAILDEICNPDFPEVDLECFLNFPENFDHAFQVYVARESEKLYFRSTGDVPDIGLNNVDNEFEAEIYKMLCAKINDKTYTLNLENQKIGSNFILTSFKNYLTDKKSTGIDLILNPYGIENDVIIKVRNYRKNGKLKLSGSDTIKYSTRGFIEYKKFGFWSKKEFGNYNVIEIPYINNQGQTCDYLKLVILNPSDFEDIKSLFEKTEELINDYVTSPLSSDASMSILPGCLFEESLCTVLKDQIPNLSWPDRKNAVINIVETTSDQQSAVLIDCFKDNYLVKPYVEIYANGAKKKLLNELVRRTYDAYPPYGNSVVGEPDFMLSGSQIFGYGDLFNNTYHQNSVTTTHQKRQFVMGQPIAYVYTIAEKEFNYFDYYPVYLEYNKNDTDSDFYFLPGSPIKTIDGKEVYTNSLVPGLYLPLASLKYHANERAEDITTAANLISLFVGFGELNLAIQTGRAALLRGILGAGEIVLATASLLTEESAFCESYNNPAIKDFCMYHKEWLPYANAILLSGAVTDIAIASFKKARKTYNEDLSPAQRDLLDADLEDAGYGKDVLKNLYRAVDLKIILKEVFDQVDGVNPHLFDAMIDQMTANGTVNNAAKLLEYALDIKTLELSKRVQFFEDVKNSIFHIDGVGYNLVKFEAGWVKGWEKLFDWPASRINISILTRRVEFDEFGSQWIKINPHTTKEMFDAPTGGYVVQHTGHNVITGNADNIAEFHMAESFARDNKVVKLLNENQPPGIKTPDAEIDGLGIFDFKNIGSNATNIETNVMNKVLDVTTQADNLVLNLGDNVNATVSRVNQGIQDAIATADNGGLSLPQHIGVVYDNGTNKILTVDEFRNGARF